MNDSDSSLELTGTFSSTDEFKTPAVASATGARGGGGGGAGPLTRPAPTLYAGGVRGGGGGKDEGGAAEADDRCVAYVVET